MSNIDDWSEPVKPAVPAVPVPRLRPQSAAAPDVPKPAVPAAPTQLSLGLDDWSEPVAASAPKAPTATAPSVPRLRAPDAATPDVAAPKVDRTAPKPPEAVAAPKVDRTAPKNGPKVGGQVDTPAPSIIDNMASLIKKATPFGPLTDIAGAVHDTAPVFEGVAAGAAYQGQNLGQTAQTLVGGTPTYSPPPRETALPDWNDKEQVARWFGFQIGQAAPAVAAGVGTAAATSWIFGPEAGVLTGAPLAAATYAALSAAQTLGPIYAQNLAAGMPKADAYSKALADAQKQGLIGGVSGALFALAPFKSAFANVFLQSTVVQPAVTVTAKIEDNLAQGKDALDGVAADYVQTAVGMLIPVGAFHGATRLFAGGKAPIPKPTSSPEEIADFLARAQAANAADPGPAPKSPGDPNSQDAIFRELLKKEGWSDAAADDLMRRVQAARDGVSAFGNAQTPPPAPPGGPQGPQPPPEAPAAPAAPQPGPGPRPSPGGAPLAPETTKPQAATPDIVVAAPKPAPEAVKPAPDIIGAAPKLAAGVETAKPTAVADRPAEMQVEPEKPANLPATLEDWSQPVTGTGTRDAPVTVLHPDDIARAGSVVNPEPTPAQADAGNYQKGHLAVPGLEGYPVSIETAAGGTRSGVGDNGEPWQVKMPAAYGYIRNTKGADGDHLDVFLGPNPTSGKAFIVNQNTPAGKFDELKVILGAQSEEEAKRLYLDSFDNGHGEAIFGGIKAFDIPALKAFLATPGAAAKPIAEPPQAAPPKLTDLIRAIIGAGGIKDSGISRGDLKAMGAYKRPGLINNKSGMTLDYMREHVAQLGYLDHLYGPTDAVHLSTVDDLLGMISWSLSGRKFYPPDQQAYVDQKSPEKLRAAAMDRARRDIEEALAGPATPELVEQAAKIYLERGGDPVDAIEAAAVRILNNEATPATKAEISASPNVPPGWDNDPGATAGTGERIGEGGPQEESGQLPGGSGGPPQAATGEKRPPDERGADGKPQGVLLGQTPNDVAKSKAGAPLKAKAPQDFTAGGPLFTHEEDSKQGDLLATPAKPAPAPQATAPREVPEWAEVVDLLPFDGPGANQRDVMKALGIMVEVSGNPKVGWKKLTDAQKIEVYDRVKAASAGIKPPPPAASEESTDGGRNDVSTGAGQGARPDKGTQGGGAQPGGARPVDVGLPESEVSGGVPGTERIPAGIAAVRDRLLGDGFPNVLAARKALTEAGWKPTGDAPLAKQQDEAIELAVVLAGRAIVAKGGTPVETYRALADLYGKQPKLGARTGKSMAEQAYSTPMPLAYIASRAAGIGPDTSVYEPTAGNGALLIAASPHRAAVNEIDDGRQAALRAQGFPHVSGDDATADISAKAMHVDAVIANPPFGTVREDGAIKVFTVGDWKTRNIDHAIALNALQAMKKKDGRAALIIAGTGGMDKGSDPATLEKARRDGYNTQARREFYSRLYNAYNVVDHFTVNGDLYAKQGAGWPVDVIVIAGRGKSALPLPGAKLPPMFDSWGALEGKLDVGHQNAADQSRPDRAPAGGAVEGKPRPQGGNAGGGKSPDGRGGVERQPAGPTDAGSVRGGGDNQQPRAAGVPGQPGERVEPAVRGVGGRAGVEPAARERKPRVTNDAGQTTYQPQSRNIDFNSLVPANIADSTKDALARVAAKHGGDVNRFVAAELGYSDNELGAYFSAEQVDALALGIEDVKNGSALVLGDQTGIGKGRVVAGMLRFAKRNDMVPVLFTEKPDLFGDMFRDLRDIGIPDPDMVMTNTNLSVPMDEEAVDWKGEFDDAVANGTKRPKRRGRFLAGGDGAAQATLFQSIHAGERKPDVVFTTYDQMNTVKGAITPRRRFLDAIVPNAMILLDEAHNAGGQGEDAASWKKADAEPDRAQFVRGLVTKAKGVLYSSATWAKRPEVMDLYRRTDMAKAVENPAHLPALIAKGGVPLQQIVSSMLADAGQYIRRERSFDGVEYTPEVVEVDRDTYDHFARAVRSIYDFDRFIGAGGKDSERMSLMAEALAMAGAGAVRDNAVGDAAASATEFSSIMHNLVNQMLLSIQAKPMAERAIAAWKAGEKPWIALSNTMETFLNDYAADKDLNLGDAVDLHFGDLLARYLDRTMRITIKDAEGKKSHVQIPLAKFSREAQDRYANALTAIENGNYSGMPVSPIDAMREMMEAAGMKVVEITGRHRIIRAGKLADRPAAETGAGGKRVSIRKFNNGPVDAVIANKSGSTGISAHATAKNDGKPRRMIIAQADPNIDTFMQMLGRINRTGQIELPRYTQSIPNVPAAARPAAALLKKMASLNANTTGARGSIFSADSADFINRYGNQVARQILQEDPRLDYQLGYILGDKGEQSEAHGDDIVRKLTGRLMLLDTTQQQEIIDRIQADYDGLIRNLDALGENALEAKSLPLAARTMNTKEVRPATGEGAFTAAVNLETVNVKSQGRAMSPEEIVEKVSALLSDAGAKLRGTTPAAKLRELNDILSRAYAQRFSASADAFQKWKREYIGGIKDATAKQKQTDQADADYGRFVELTDRLTPGAVVKLTSSSGSQPAVVLEIRRPGKAKNPVALGSWRVSFAIPDAGREVSFSLTNIVTEGSKVQSEGAVTVGHSDVKPNDLMAMFEAARKEGREDRQMITGNILAGFDVAGGHGQIVQYTTEGGEVRPGILMSRGFDRDAFLEARPVRFPTARAAAAFLAKVPADNDIKSLDGYATVRRDGSTYSVLAAAGRPTGGRYYLDAKVRAAVGDKFVKAGSVMVAKDLAPRQAEAAIQAMMNLNAVFETKALQAEATEVVKADRGGPNPRRQAMAGVATAKPFYSAVVRAVEASKTAKASPDQWLATIRNTPGVKAEELEWMGLADWLKGQTGSVTQEALTDFVRANQIEVKETDLGGEGGRLTSIEDIDRMFPQAVAVLKAEGLALAISPDGAEIMFDDGENDLMSSDDITQITDDDGEPVYGAAAINAAANLERAFASGDGAEGRPRFKDYQLPGGEDYHELLLSLPEKAATGKEGPAGWADANNARSREGDQNYRSSHFDTPNIVAHVRFNTRTDAEGKRTLFVEEIQSDWHQAGRKRGYREPKIAAERDARFASAKAEYERIDLILRDQERRANAAADGMLTDAEMKDRERLVAEQMRALDGMNAIHDARYEEGRKGVPDAPFRTSWPELALKRMVRWAAENGYDQIAWTPGIEQVKRYEAPLRQQVRSIAWSKAAIESKHVAIQPHRGEEIWLTLDTNGVVVGQQGVRQDTKGQPIEDIVGKEVGRRIMAEDSGKIEGDGLVIGGKGMEDFYDKMLVNAANKLGKKFGAAVGRANIDVGGYKVRKDGHATAPFRVEDRDSPDALARFATGEEAFAEADRRGARAVHSLPITPTMRNSVMGGQALFNRKPGSALTLSPLPPAEREAIVNNVQSIVTRIIGNRVPVTFEETIKPDWTPEHSIGPAAAAAKMDLVPTIGGFYEHVPGFPAYSGITIALGDTAYNPDTTARHEPWHDVWQFLLTDDERRVLAADAARGARSTLRRYAAPEFGVDPSNPLIMQMPIEELTAVAFQRADREYEAGEKNLQGSGLHVAIRKMLGKLRSVFTSIKRMLGRRGYTSVDQIFGATSRGEMKARPDIIRITETDPRAWDHNDGRDPGFAPAPRRMAARAPMPGPTPPTHERATRLADDMFRLRSNRQKDIIEFRKAVQAAAREIKRSGIVYDPAHLYAYGEGDPQAVLTPEQRAFWDAMVAPDKVTESALGREARRLAGLAGYTADEMDTLSPDGYMHRMVRGRSPDIDRVMGEVATDPIMGDRAYGRSLRKDTSSMKARVWFAMEGPNGQRIVISKGADGLYGWRNGQAAKIPGTTADTSIKPGTVLRSRGALWRINQAKTREIEAHTASRYYKDPIIATKLNIIYLKQVIRNLEFLRRLKADTTWLENFTSGINATPPKGWVRVDIPGLHGFAHPDLGNVINDYLHGARLIDGGNYGWIDWSLEKAEGLNRAITGTLFLFPTKHLLNIWSHWFTARGWDWANPAAYPRMVKAFAIASREAATDGPLYRRFLQSGGSLIASRITDAAFVEDALRNLGHEIEKDPRRWAGILGLPITAMSSVARGIYRRSSLAMWRGGDILMLAGYIEHALAEGRVPGEGIESAIRKDIAETEGAVPNYRIPSKVMGSRIVSKFLQDVLFSRFMSYRYGQFRAYSRMIGKIAGRKGGRAAWEGVGEALAHFALFGLISAGGAAITAAGKEMFGDQFPDVAVAPMGALSIGLDVLGMLTGAKNPLAVAGVWASQQALSPVNILWNAIEQGFGSDIALPAADKQKAKNKEPAIFYPYSRVKDGSWVDGLERRMASLGANVPIVGMAESAGTFGVGNELAYQGLGLQLSPPPPAPTAPIPRTSFPARN